MKKWAVSLVLLGGCQSVGDALIPETMSNMRAVSSQEAYKTCLQNMAAAQKKNEAPSSDCEVERKLYEIDLEARRSR